MNFPSSTQKKEDSHTDTKIERKPANPHGSYLLFNLLKNFEKTASIEGFQTTNKKTLKSQLKIKKDLNGLPSLYVSVIEEFYLRSADERHLLDFVMAGNYALISSDKFITELGIEAFGNSLNVDFEILQIDTTVEVNFIHPDFKTEKPLTLLNDDLNYHRRPKFKKWNRFDKLLNTENGAIISYIGNEFPTAIIAEYGDGFFIFHSQPHNFSNVNIVRKDGTRNAENIFSHFPNHNIKWHQNYGKYSPSRLKPRPKTHIIDNNNISRSSPLQYILKQPALLFALILILVGLLVYMLIFSKRRQKIIPPVEPNENASLEFVSVVSQLYFKQKQHNKLVFHLKSLFRSFIQDHYYITLDFKNDKNLELLSDKSGINITKIQDIIETFNSAKNKTFTEADLINLYIKLDNFYQHCN